MGKAHFINLTNGLQAIEDYGLSDFHFMRLQSTACEQKHWHDILLTIPDDFLMRVAMGDECVVYDYGANKKTPRAIWQGLEWVKFALSRRWHGQNYMPAGRAVPCADYFACQYGHMNNRVKNRLDYYRRFVSGPMRISSVTSPTKLDGQMPVYVDMMRAARPARISA